MKDYKIYFDLGKIEYFENNCLIQVYKFISFYDICEMVFAFHLPPDELITNVIFKEKINSYKSNPLLNQQAEIKDFCTQEEKWCRDEITTRKRKILDFCEKRWKF